MCSNHRVDGHTMLQDGLMIGNAPDFTLSLKGEEIFHKVSLAVWRNGLLEPADTLSERGLSGLRKKVLDIVRAKTHYGKLVAGANDFGICEVPAKGVKITVNIMWNERLSPESVAFIWRYYVTTFYPVDGMAKVPDDTSEGGPKSN